MSKWAMGPSGDLSDCVGLCTIAAGTSALTDYTEIPFSVMCVVSLHRPMCVVPQKKLASGVARNTQKGLCGTG